MRKRTASLTSRILILLLFLVVPLNIVSLVATTVMIHDSQNSIKDSIRSTIKSYNDKIDLVISNTDYLLYYLANHDVNCYKVMTGPDNIDYQLSKTALAATLNQQRSMIQIANYFYYYREDLNDLMVIPHNTNMVSNYLKDNAYFSDNEFSAHSRWHLITLDKKPYLIRLLKYNNTYYGALIALDPLVEDIGSFLHYPVNQLSFSSDAPIDNGQLDVFMKCKDANLYLALSFDNSVINRNVSYWRWALIIIVMLYLFLIPSLYRFIYRWFIHPLQLLNHAHEQLKQGNQEYRITTNAGSREYEQAYGSFNNMADGLQKLRLENINKELAYKQMLLNNLQLQIRPHFLLNTFNQLFTMMQLRQIENAKQTILYLSQYFRYLFRYDRDLELFPKEFELVKKYLAVSALQYPDTFTFTYDLDPEINLVRIPPLLLHNFMENIISHALIHGRIIHIMFYGAYDNGTVTFQIADDGRGITQEEVDQINSGNYENYKRGKHVGIRNSITRLKYFYEQKSSVHVESTLNEGTIFTITFPYNLEENDDESFDGE